MKTIFKVLMGALLIAVIVFVGGRLYFSMKKKEYRQQLENAINNKYLEGKDVIGAFYYYDKNDSTTIKKVSDFTTFGISETSIIWSGRYFSHAEVVTKMMQSGIYKWYDFEECATLRPFMIIVKKTNRGYDIIGEFILGIGLTNLYPDYLITREPFRFNFGKIETNYMYKIKIDDMINSYFQYLFEDKYKDITIRNEITRESNLPERNKKFDMLNDLVMKFIAVGDSSLYFRVNKYFELKYDDYFTEIGSSPIVWETGTYGNQAQTLFRKTVTLHYSIQENEGVLEKEYKKGIINCLIVIESIYLALLFMILYSRKWR